MLEKLTKKTNRASSSCQTVYINQPVQDSFVDSKIKREEKINDWLRNKYGLDEDYVSNAGEVEELCQDIVAYFLQDQVKDILSKLPKESVCDDKKEYWNGHDDCRDQFINNLKSAGYIVEE